MNPGEGGYIFSRFLRSAMVTASARDDAPSFSHAAVMCCFTALTDMPRSLAIWSDVFPSATPSRSSRWRLESSVGVVRQSAERLLMGYD